MTFDGESNVHIDKKIKYDSTDEMFNQVNSKKMLWKTTLSDELHFPFCSV